jgi:non-ribosomal peptide synthetase component F
MTICGRGHQPINHQQSTINSSAETIARNLHERGLSGQNVLISLPRSFEFVWAFLGCLRAGAVAVPLDFPGAEIAFEITDQNIRSLLQTNPGPLPPQPPAEAPAAIFLPPVPPAFPKALCIHIAPFGRWQIIWLTALI